MHTRHHDTVAEHLRTAHTHLTRSARWQRTRSRWAAQHPVLDANPDELRNRFAHPHHREHTATCVALLRLHQAGDTDATTMLLTAIGPLVGSLSYRHHETERFDHLWAAAARLLATINPDTIGTDAPFLITFMGRLRRDTQRARNAERRSSVEPHPTNTTRPAVPAFGPRIASTVEDIVIARATLTAIATHVRAGEHGERRWHELVEHTIHAVPATATTRVRVHRLRHQLADLNAA